MGNLVFKLQFNLKIKVLNKVLKVVHQDQFGMVNNAFALSKDFILMGKLVFQIVKANYHQIKIQHKHLIYNLIN
jgi:hypothetical protein